MSIYPQLEELPPAPYGATGMASDYRLTKISEIECYLKSQRDFRAGLYKKYRRTVNILNGIDNGLSAAGLGLGAAGTVLMSAVIITAPIALGLQAAAIVCGLSGVTTRFISHRLNKKVKKHGDIRLLAVAKLNTVADHISRALSDGKISEEEFKKILSEVDKFEQMKVQIRSKATPVAVGEAEKKRFLEMGRFQEKQEEERLKFHAKTQELFST